MSTIPTCAVRAVVRSSVGGTPIAGARVSAKLIGFEKYQGLVVPLLVTETTDALGVATLHLFPNELGAAASFYEIKVTGLGATLRVTAVVPNLAVCTLEDIMNLDPYPGEGGGTPGALSYSVAQTLSNGQKQIVINNIGLTDRLAPEGGVDGQVLGKLDGGLAWVEPPNVGEGGYEEAIEEMLNLQAAARVGSLAAVVQIQAIAIELRQQQ